MEEKDNNQILEEGVLNKEDPPVADNGIAEEELKLKKQKLLPKLLYLLLNAAIVITIIIIEKNRSGIGNLGDLIRQTEKGVGYLCLAALMLVVMILARACCYMIMLSQLGYGLRVKTSIMTMLIGKYYDDITPFAMGGQPFQMYYLHANGISNEAAISLPIIQHSVKLVSINVVTIFMYIFVQTGAMLGIQIAAWVGVAVNLAFPAWAIVFALKKDLAEKCARGAIRIGYKMKLVKNLDATLDKVSKQAQQFVENFRFLGSHPWLLLGLCIFSILEVLSLVSIPFFVIRGFGVNVEYLDSIVRGMMAMNASSFIPTPGTAGGAEAYFYGLFGEVLGDGDFFWAVMTWRFLTYYVFILIGFGMNIGMIIRSYKKTKAYNLNIFKRKMEMLKQRKTAEQPSSAENVTPPDTPPAEEEIK